ncbi:MAG: alkylhydroperoxidase AhpD family core domain-containing protein [Chloroflexi bacterium]|nr:MAG: alkylhydroperoxidase AhpD family core domain-containing protein [Chloroflexota bacterium]
MRLAILDHGHGVRAKAMFALIRVFSGHPVVDAVKLALYRPSFYRGGGLTQEAMRGPSDWSVADRELMAAFVSKVNNTEFCIAAHTATSALAYKDGAKVSAALADLETAPLTEPLRSTLRMLGKLTRENNVDVDDISRVLAAGVSEQQIKDALAVALAFNVTDRLADVFDFAVDDSAAIKAGAKYLLARGYR